MVQNRAENAFFIYLIEPSKPIICPTHVHRVNRFVPVPRYYSTSSTSEETICPGQANQGMNNMGQTGNFNI